MSLSLALHLLGPPYLALDGQSIHLERRKSMALLTYLAVEGGQHQRDFLSSLLWPDINQSNAFKNLRQILWDLQQSLGEGWLVSSREKIYLEADSSRQIWLDVHEFAALASEGETSEDIKSRLPLLVDAARLYRNHFLTGFSLKDASPFNDWALVEAEGLRQKLSNILNRIAEDYCALGQARKAIPYAQRLVSYEPLEESAHRLLMNVYLQAGQHAAALKQYQTCEQILRKELGLDPQPETRALYKKIRKGELKPILVEKTVQTISPGHNLPHSLSTFIGREKQLEEISKLFAKSQLVTLLGTGGIGKTSLSIQVGHRLLEQYPDGVWFVALDSLSNPALVPQTVASIFELRDNPAQPVQEGLIEHLRAKTILLILDNCEHLLDACAQLVIALMQQCPNVHVLATSRETLNITGEAVYTMPSLSLPESDLPVAQLMQYEAIQLFIERATLVLTSFTLTEENANPVAEICRKVDGIPLAIELAAARVNFLQEEEILGQLQQSFALLASDSRSILARHQTLQASIDWSWSLLSEAEHRFLCQLSVFAGGWTLEAAQAVCDQDVLGPTSTLVKKSIIMVNQARPEFGRREPGRGTRYHFHEMMREYIHEKTHLAGNDHEIHARHLKYTLALAEKAEHELRGPSRGDWLERLNEERNNLRVALHWAEQTDVEAGLHLAGTLRRYWESFNLREGLGHLETLLNKPEAREFPKARAQALLTYGWLLSWLQNFDLADSVTQEGLNIYRAIGDRHGEVDALVLAENVAQYKYDMKTALAIGKQALELARAMNNPWQEANALYFLGWNTRDYPLMFNYWEHAIVLYRQVGDLVSLANILGLLGQFRVLNGDVALAETYINEAMQIWETNRRANIWENPKIAKSLICTMQGDHEQARSLLLEALAFAIETGNTMAQLWAEVRLGHAALRAGDLDTARQYLAKTARAFSKDGYDIGGIFALEGMASLHFIVGKPEHFARLIGWADEMRMKMEDIRPNIEQADVDRMIAASIVKMGEEAFSDAYDSGRGMSVEDAVEYGLGGMHS